MVNLGTWSYGILALYCMAKSWHTITRNSEQNFGDVFWISFFGIWCATPFLYYQFLAPSMSHIPGLFLSSALLFLGLKYAKTQVVSSLLLSAVIFLLCVVRWQNILLVASAMPLFFMRYEGGSFRLIFTKRLLLVIFLPMILAFFIQFVIWNTLYGDPFLIPQGSNFIRSEFHGLSILLSSNRGLLLWSPFLVLLFPGVYWMWRRFPLVASAVISAFFLPWLVNGSLSDLGGGDSFGARRFLEAFPFFFLAIAVFLERFSRYRKTIFVWTALCVVLNFFALEWYRLGYIPRSGMFDVWTVFFGRFF